MSKRVPCIFCHSLQTVDRNDLQIGTQRKSLRHRTGRSEPCERARALAHHQGSQIRKLQLRLRKQSMHSGNQLCRCIGATYTVVMPSLVTLRQGHRHHVGAGVKGQKFQDLGHCIQV